MERARRGWKIDRKKEEWRIRKQQRRKECAKFKFETILWLQAIRHTAAAHHAIASLVTHLLCSRILQQLFIVYENKLKIDFKLNLCLRRLCTETGATKAPSKYRRSVFTLCVSAVISHSWIHKLWISMIYSIVTTLPSANDKPITRHRAVCTTIFRQMCTSWQFFSASQLEYYTESNKLT